MTTGYPTRSCRESSRTRENVVVVVVVVSHIQRIGCQPEKTTLHGGQRGPGGKDTEWADCVADGLRLFGITGDWSTAALDPGVWYSTVHEGGCRFMAAWVKEEENASKHRLRKRDADEADKVEVAPGVTVASLRRF